MLWYAKFCSRVSFVNSTKVKLATDIIILLATSYLMFKKLFDFSLSKWLSTHVFQQQFVGAYEFTSGSILALAILLKIFGLLLEYFPSNEAKNIEPREISDCIQAINKEIVGHLNKCANEKPVNVRRLNEQHTFDINIRLIISALAEHIRGCCDGVKIKNKDIFISLYAHDDSEHLRYVCHYDPKRDGVKSKTIHINDTKYKDYECVKCMHSGDSTTYLLNKDGYSRGNSKRHKTVQQYMGCKLEADGRTLGFLNIELHNNPIFISDDDMQDFMENNVFPYKALLEYQFLKREFFSTFKDFETHWRVQ